MRATYKPASELKVGDNVYKLQYDRIVVDKVVAIEIGKSGNPCFEFENQGPSESCSNCDTRMSYDDNIFTTYEQARAVAIEESIGQLEYSQYVLTAMTDLPETEAEYLKTLEP
jgi:hypothetical protein